MPTAYIVNFFCRFTDLSDEVRKLRPARWIQSDGIIRSYCYREAQGHEILQVIPSVIPTHKVDTVLIVPLPLIGVALNDAFV